MEMIVGEENKTRLSRTDPTLGFYGHWSKWDPDLEVPVTQIRAPDIYSLITSPEVENMQIINV